MSTRTRLRGAVSIAVALALASALSLPTTALATPSVDDGSTATLAAEQQELMQTLEGDATASQPVDEEELAAMAAAADGGATEGEAQAADAETYADEGAAPLSTHEIYLTEEEAYSEYYNESLCMVNFNFTVKQDSLVLFKLYADGESYESRALYSLQDAEGTHLDSPGLLRGGWHDLYWTLPAGNYKVNVMASDDSIFLSAMFGCMIPEYDQQVFAPTNKTLESAAPVELNKNILGVHFNVGNDGTTYTSGYWYSFTIVEPSVVTVRLASYARTLFGVFDANGEVVEDAAGYGLAAELIPPQQSSGLAVIDCKTLQPGTYYLFVAHDGYVESWGEQYVCNITSAPEWASFSDVDYNGATADGWMADWIIQAYNLGLMSGDRDAYGQFMGLFHPTGTLTRAQAVLVLYRAMTGAASDEPNGYDTTGFRDIDKTTYYTNALNWAYENGIVSGGVDAAGNPDGRFRPNDSISRQELALMVWRAAGEQTAQNTSTYFATVDHGSEWASATPALQWTAEQGILSGSVLPDGTYLKPGDQTLRGQAAKIFVSSLPFLQQGSTRYGNCEIDISDNTATVLPIDGTDGVLAPRTDGYPWRTNTSIQRVVFEDGTKVEGAFDCAAMFAGCSNLTSIDLSGLDTSEVTSMADMFSGCTSLVELNLTGVDTSGVVNMGRMFEGCLSLTELDVTGFDTSNVTIMDLMFNLCESLTSLDLSSFDTGRNVGFAGMFQGCASLTELDLSSFDTSRAQNMQAMFRGCTALESVNVSSFNTSTVTNFSQMFESCTSLEELDLSSFDTSNAQAMYGIFSSEYEGQIVLNCDALRSVKLGPSFTFEGNGSMSSPCFLSTPSPDAIPGATGLWVNSLGETFAPNAIPSNTADTYTAQIA